MNKDNQETEKSENDKIIQSPCNGKCNLDGDGFYCTGCFRTINEIRYWTEFSNTYKLSILKKCEIRKTKDLNVIPKGMYCYTPIKFNKSDGSLDIDLCPYWGLHPDMPEQSNGFCLLNGTYDWNEDGFGGLLWDQCKECGINDYTDEDLEEIT